MACKRFLAQMAAFSLAFATLIAVSRTQQVERHRIELESVPPAPSGLFGGVVAAHRDWIMAVYGYLAGGGPGTSVHVFRRVGANWLETQTISPTTGSIPIAFGSMFAFVADRLLIADYAESSSGQYAGRIDTYQLVGNTWLERRPVVPSSLAAGDYFGVSMWASGDKVAVGAPRSDIVGPNVGVVFLMRWTGNGWVEDGILQPANPQSYNMANFGWHVALDGDNLAATAFTPTPPPGAVSGHVVITFRRTASGWNQTGMLLSPFNVFESDFGVDRIVLEGEWLFVADAPDPLFGLRGRVQVFRQAPNGTWNHFQTLFGDPGYGNDGFGWYVGVRDSRLFVASGALHSPSGTARGFVFQYRFNGLQWVQTSRLTSSDVLSTPSAAGAFPTELAVTEDWVVVSDYLAPIPGATHTGRLYGFEFPIGTPTCTGTPGPMLVPVPLHASGSRTVGIGSIDLHATELEPGSTAMLLAAPSPGWVVAPGGSIGVLCLGQGVRRIGSSVAPADASGEWRHLGLPLGGVGAVSPVPAQAGETWHFQLWYRQPGPASNFSDGLAIQFR